MVRSDELMIAGKAFDATSLLQVPSTENGMVVDTTTSSLISRHE